MSGDAAAAAGKQLSLAQQAAALWGDAQLKVYAVILGHRVPGLRALLEAADVDDWDGLWTGELTPAERDAAPHLALLRRDAPFSSWLLRDAGAAHGDWGVFVRSSKPFLQMRSHGRALCEATLPVGTAVRIDWADREVIDALLPLAQRPQLERVFGNAVESIVVAGGAQWVRLSAPMGQLAVQRSGVA